MSEQPIEPDDVLPPEDGARKPRRGAAERAQRAFGPIVAGVILDFVDLASMGVPGYVLGLLVGFWLASVFKLPWTHRIVLALLAAAYCAVPFTHFIPLATVIGAYIRFREG